MQSPGEPAGHHYGWMDTWISLYDAEPFADPRLTPELQQRVLGAMAEQVRVLISDYFILLFFRCRSSSA